MHDKVYFKEEKMKHKEIGLFNQFGAEIRMFIGALRFKNFESAKYSYERLRHLYTMYQGLLIYFPGINYVLYKVLDWEDWVLPKIKGYVEQIDNNTEDSNLLILHYDNGIKTALKVLDETLYIRFLGELSKSIVISDMGKICSNKIT